MPQLLHYRPFHRNHEFYKFAEKVCKLTEEELHVRGAKDEVGYLAIYIEKLKVELDKKIIIP
ncbi:PRD domain-containing protein [Clostridium thermarum]|uniref:PRD domain-containing protein n=1 Tax=Clostridium thermarum TaxID=1716543 RepID=UPI0013D32B34